jgi:hypothetical protein
MFRVDESLTLFDAARAQRCIGLLGPLLYSHEGWQAHLDAVKQRWDGAEAEREEDTPAR